MKVPHPIPYQGSKRNIAKYILPFFPNGIDTLVEPFAGSAALSIAAAFYGKSSHFRLNDLNGPLVSLLEEIINTPQRITADYEELWVKQHADERQYYDWVRNEFNRTHRPDYLLYLLARCVKASVRYNPKGEFNQSPDNRRSGRHPKRMAEDIFAVSNLLRGKTIITNQDYRTVIEHSTPTDLVYLDPPYQGVCNTGDPRYYAGVQFDEFIDALSYLNTRSIPFILSYDGRTGAKKFGKELPDELKLHQIEIEAGRSSQATLLGTNDVTYESVYLSPVVQERLDNRHHQLVKQLVEARPFQPRLIAI
jgi:DNA adenine methylase